MRSKFPPIVYQAMKASPYGLSNVKIAELLGVSEAAVRRALDGWTPPATPTPTQQFVITVTPVE